MGGQMGEKKQKKFMQGKMGKKEKEEKRRKTQRKRIHAQDGLHLDKLRIIILDTKPDLKFLILNQNYNSSRKVFQNAPNGIRACLNFKNSPKGGCPRTLWVICRMPNKKC